MESEASEVTRAIKALYGLSPLLARGVVHVTSTVRARDGRLHAIKIGPDAPRSATDFFVLNLCRARADAILTSAANLRAEPQLSHALHGSSMAGLRDYRARVLGKTLPPCCAILTRSLALPLEHPVWGDGTPKLVLTTREAEAPLAKLLGERAEVRGIDALDPSVACALLQARGHALLSVELGPSSAASLYGAADGVDELLLSTYEEPLAEALVGPSLPEDHVLFAGRTCAANGTREESSGSWRFQRWVRARRGVRPTESGSS